MNNNYSKFCKKNKLLYSLYEVSYFLDTATCINKALQLVQNSKYLSKKITNNLSNKKYNGK